LRRALLFDLDETLIVEEPAAVAAFRATAEHAGGLHELDVETLALAARAHARVLWHASPTHPYCARIGISSWEGLWCRFEGDEAPLRRLRQWAPAYRRESWRLALADQDIEDLSLATTLGERFGEERRERHEVFPDAAGVLAALRDRYALGVLTNGVSCLQREKLVASGLAGSFDAVVVSAEFGAGKPDPGIFRHALSLLGCEPSQSTMIGDNLVRDVDGALGAGLGAVWLDRDGAMPPADRPGVPAIATLSELPHVLS
jgi:putative hydrolase of the HAD superfamily